MFINIVSKNMNRTIILSYKHRYCETRVTSRRVLAYSKENFLTNLCTKDRINIIWLILIFTNIFLSNASIIVSVNNQRLYMSETHD